jgi:hypothetical protein
MKEKKLNIDANGLELCDSKSMILDLIDNQIKNHNLQFLVNWERDHSISSEENEKKIKALRTLKCEVIEFFNSCNTDDLWADFQFSIDIKVKQKTNVAA